jgi:hypothetical protein
VKVRGAGKLFRADLRERPYQNNAPLSVSVGEGGEAIIVHPLIDHTEEP